MGQKYTENRRKQNIKSSLVARERNLHRVEICFNQNDQKYLDKWNKIPVDTNIGKIRYLLDKLFERVGKGEAKRKRKEKPDEEKIDPWDEQEKALR